MVKGYPAVVPRVAAGVVPGAVILAATRVMIVYPLTEKVFRSLVAEMAQRRAGVEPATVVDAST